MWYAGIDWADQHHDVVVIDEAGHPPGAQAGGTAPLATGNQACLLLHSPSEREGYAS